MNIYTVRDNLKKTIEGKEAYLVQIREARNRPIHPGTDASLVATQEMLKINIDELKRILQDVETCCEKATEDSWRLSPDRSGGQYTQDELYDPNRTGWIEP